ncbi:MAG TPA: PQQ-dependent sugar dehydrogenase, partial [Blastocatellia bacterium]|nr:PQQ-dependent sugar dehydrogenase [Blastocatellia bacterium]
MLTGLRQPLYLTGAGDGSNRIFVVERTGRIKVRAPGAVSATVFLNISEEVGAGGENGLLGLAFHPQYETNRRFYVSYTRRSDGALVVAEYRASKSDPNVAQKSERPVLIIPQPSDIHHGGMINFGPDNFLYLSTGDGYWEDPENSAQDTASLRGKILRIDVDRPGEGAPYSSPESNPFFGDAPGRDEIYALGFRNPWRFSFDRLTGELYVGDVGHEKREEINLVTRGGNYGWRVFEGTLCTNFEPSKCNSLRTILPLIEYDHTGGRCSVTAGYVYRGEKETLPAGAYVYGDFCTGEIFLADGAGKRLLIDTDLNITSFGEDDSGEIYVVSLGGTVHRLVSSDALESRIKIDSIQVRNR